MGIRIQQKETCSKCKKEFYWTLAPEDTDEIPTFVSALPKTAIEVKCSHCDAPKRVNLLFAAAKLHAEQVYLT